MSTHRVYLGNLPWDSGEDELAALLAGAGLVADVRLARDRRRGKSRGFGFVTAASQDEAERVRALFSGFMLRGRALAAALERAKDRTPGGARERLPAPVIEAYRGAACEGAWGAAGDQY